MKKTFFYQTNKPIQQLVLTAMFLALGIVLPFFFGQVPQIGSMLLPMHIPVFLCAFICTWRYGVPMAIILPLLRSLLFSRPNFYPEAISIAFEMATYAFVGGHLYSAAKQKNLRALYGCMLISMASGRLVRISLQMFLLGMSGASFAFGAVVTGVVVSGIPGILLQLFLIPAVMLIVGKTDPVRHNISPSPNTTSTQKHTKK